MNKSCNINITHVISDQVSGNFTIKKSILHDQSSHVISKLYVESLIHVNCHVMPTSPHIESTLRHIISLCSLQLLPLQFSIAVIKIAAKNQAVLSTAPGAPLQVYHPVEQLNPGGVGVLTPTLHPLQPAACSLLQWGGKHL
jgi:hypothetical protein